MASIGLKNKIVCWLTENPERFKWKVTEVAKKFHVDCRTVIRARMEFLKNKNEGNE